MGAGSPLLFGTRAPGGILWVFGLAALACVVLGQDLGGDFEIEYNAPASGPPSFTSLNATATLISLLDDPAIAATDE
ncbi:hypothetical protein WJX72_012541 [[Myrmecia] bisecta]|uniref:Uncharacterized protein n=1 Tax=[Myrmecia] bisecta TaxID=41462 RepID=A0AAW1QTA7_9CHLO